MSKTSAQPATVRKTEKMGAVVSILGIDYTTRGYMSEARDLARKINARCAGKSKSEIIALYKLGDE